MPGVGSRTRRVGGKLVSSGPLEEEETRTSAGFPVAAVCSRDASAYSTGLEGLPSGTAKGGGAAGLMILFPLLYRRGWLCRLGCDPLPSFPFSVCSGEEIKISVQPSQTGKERILSPAEGAYKWHS